jgi:hypothetical protein
MALLLITTKEILQYLRVSFKLRHYPLSQCDFDPCVNETMRQLGEDDKEEEEEVLRLFLYMRANRRVTRMKLIFKLYNFVDNNDELILQIFYIGYNF